ncbi:MAG: Flp pilus assembly protein CpaB [Candidatus Omnitrophota bacterium]
MQKQRIILIVGIILAAVVVVLIKIYLDQQRKVYVDEAAQRAVRIQQNQTSVLVAKEEIPKGMTMGPELFEPQIVPKQYVVPQAVTSVDRVSGMVAVVPIAKGEQISLTKLTFPRETRTGGGLAEVTPVGKRAITITVDNMASVAGMVRPGNYVDILASIPVPMVTPDGKQTAQAASVPLLQNVLILAVGQQISPVMPSAEESGRYEKGGGQQSRPQAQPQQASSLITIALTPQEANLAAFVQEQGKLRLILRSPADSQMQPLQPISWEALFQYLLPKESVKQAAKPPPEPTEYVEIYRGLKREKIPLSK